MKEEQHVERTIIQSEHRKLKDCDDGYQNRGLKREYSSAHIAIKPGIGEESHDEFIQKQENYQYSEYIWGRTYDTGLINRGSTCYLNTCLQVLFHTDVFRKKIMEEEIEIERHGRQASLRKDQRSNKRLTHQLKELFTEMLLTDKPAINTRIKLKEIGDTGWDEHLQHDAHECMTHLISTITNKKDKLQEYVEGKTETQVHCHNCQTITRKEDSFITLDVPIKHVNHLTQGIEKLLQQEDLQGENQYHCEKCKNKQDAHRVTVIKEFPEILMVQLLRFDVNKTNFRRYKLENDVFFTAELDVNPFLEKENGDTMYTLYAIIVHAGTTSSGHYIAFIKDFHGLWFKYDDENVTTVMDTSKIISGAFQPYLLFYRKKTAFDRASKRHLQELQREKEHIDQSLMKKVAFTNEKFHNSMMKQNDHYVPVFIQYSTSSEFFHVDPHCTWKYVKDILLERLMDNIDKSKLTLFNIQSYPHWRTTFHYDMYDDTLIRDIPFKSLLFTWSVKDASSQDYQQINILQYQPKKFVDHWVYEHRHTTSKDLYEHIIRNNFIQRDFFCYKQNDVSEFTLIEPSDTQLSTIVGQGESIVIASHCQSHFKETLKFVINIPRFENANFTWSTTKLELPHHATILNLKEKISTELLNAYPVDHFFMSTGKHQSYIITDMNMPLSHFFMYQNLYVFKGKQVGKEEMLVHFLSHHTGIRRERPPDIHLKDDRPSKIQKKKHGDIHIDGDHLHYAIQYKKTDFWYTSHTDIFSKDTTIQQIHEQIQPKIFQDHPTHFVLRNSLQEHVFAGGSVFPDKWSIRQIDPFRNEMEMMVDVEPQIVNLPENPEGYIIIRVRRYHPIQQRMARELEFAFAPNTKIESFVHTLSSMYNMEVEKLWFSIVRSDTEPSLVFQETLNKIQWRDLNTMNPNMSIFHYPLCLDTGTLVLILHADEHPGQPTES